MAKLKLRDTYRSMDTAHMLHGATVPSEFVNSVNRIYAGGEGAILTDIEGREYIDFMSSGLVAALGYGHPELVQESTKQMSRLNSCPSFANRASLPEIELADKLAQLAPPGIQRFVFTNSGSDANDTAIKIARWYWREKGRDKHKIICLEHAYHGATYGAMSATSFTTFTHKYFGPFVPGFFRIPPPYCYRCPLGKTYPGCGIDCALALEEVIQKEGADTVAAFLSEPLQTANGTLVPPPEYWPKVMEICRKYEILLIVDEYITGFGRMGRFFVSEHFGIQPDMVMFAKGLGGGYFPMAALGITEDVYEGLIKTDQAFPHVFTYGGHPVSCAVALKAVEIMIRHGLMEKATRVGKEIRDRLDTMQEKSPYIGDVRGFGLYFGIELVADKTTREPFAPERKVSVAVRARLADKGIIVGGFGPNNITLGPPLIITMDEVEYVLDGLDRAIGEIEP